MTTDNDYEHSNQHSSRKASGELHANIEEIFLEGNWNHICVVLNKSVVRRSTASVYANGRCIVSTSRVRSCFFLSCFGSFLLFLFEKFALILLIVLYCQPSHVLFLFLCANFRFIQFPYIFHTQGSL